MHRFSSIVLLLSLLLLVSSSASAQFVFQRGDSNDDEKVDLADSATTLGYIFFGITISCDDAADANDDGNVDLADSAYLLQFLFQFGPQTPSPGPDFPGLDPTADNLTCDGPAGSSARSLIDHVIRIGTAEDISGSIVAVDVSLEIPPGSSEVDGWSLNISYDPSVVTAVNFSDTGVAELLLVDLGVPGIVTLAGGVDFDPPFSGATLPVGIYTLHTIQFSLNGAAGQSTELMIVDEGRVDTLTIVDAYSYTPITNDGSITISPPDADFMRGDFSGDGARDIGDAVSLLSFLFSAGNAPACPDTADANDDGTIDVGDAIALLAQLFSGAAIPAPSSCGADLTVDTLATCSYSACP